MFINQSVEEVLSEYHRGKTFYLDDPICNETASLPSGVVRMADNDLVLDELASFVVDSMMLEVHKTIQVKSHKFRRYLGLRVKAHPEYLSSTLSSVTVAVT